MIFSAKLWVVDLYAVSALTITLYEFPWMPSLLIQKNDFFFAHLQFGWRRTQYVNNSRPEWLRKTGSSSTRFNWHPPPRVFQSRQHPWNVNSVYGGGQSHQRLEILLIQSRGKCLQGRALTHPRSSSQGQ